MNEVPADRLKKVAKYILQIAYAHGITEKQRAAIEETIFTALDDVTPESGVQILKEIRSLSK